MQFGQVNSTVNIEDLIMHLIEKCKPENIIRDREIYDYHPFNDEVTPKLQ